MPIRKMCVCVCVCVFMQNIRNKALYKMYVKEAKFVLIFVSRCNKLFKNKNIYRQSILFQLIYIYIYI